MVGAEGMKYFPVQTNSEQQQTGVKVMSVRIPWSHGGGIAIQLHWFWASTLNFGGWSDPSPKSFYSQAKSTDKRRIRRWRSRSSVNHYVFYGGNRKFTALMGQEVPARPSGKGFLEVFCIVFKHWTRSSYRAWNCFIRTLSRVLLIREVCIYYEKI